MTAGTIPTTARFAASRETSDANELAKSSFFSLAGVSVKRGPREILRGLSTEIVAGSITAVVGRSGVGKTTLLCLLNGLLTPACGAISVAGIGPLDGADAIHKHRCRTGTVFQEHALIDRLTALDNVLLGLADMRHPLSLLPWPKPMVVRAAEALRDVGLLGKATTRVSQLSGGERQRVGIARALVRKPHLLLADEPFASVDLTLVRQLSQELMSAVDRTGLTVVIVLHQIETALAMADRIIGLANGCIAYDGPSNEFDDHAQSRIFGD
ncbi:MAG: ATP-binding cassette domain-containing protein [Acidobacteria bacterium]|nr:ATP-binding cassette domain-containing protein [Acidobacteriota bacterium]